MDGRTNANQNYLLLQTITTVIMILIIVVEIGVTQNNLSLSEKMQKVSLLGKNSGKHSFIEKLIIFCFKLSDCPRIYRISTTLTSKNDNLGHSWITPFLLIQLQIKTLSSNLWVIFSHLIVPFSILKQLLVSIDLVFLKRK